MALSPLCFKLFNSYIFYVLSTLIFISISDRKEKKAFIDILLDMSDKSENAFSIVDIREQVDTFMFEVSEMNEWTIF